MTEIRLSIPGQLKLVSQVSNLGIKRINLNDDQTLIVDFSGTKFGQPLAMLVLQRELQLLRDKYPNAPMICRTVKNDFTSYAGHIGYFDLLGVPKGKKIGLAKGGTTYVPIQKYDLELLKASSGDRPYGEIIEEKANHLAEVLTQSDRSETFKILQYCLREIMRNSIEHSFGKNLVVLGQFWPLRNEAEIVIYDDGCGIAATIQNTHPSLVGSAALVKALEPGVSGVSEYEMQYQHPDYRNSGFGLFVTSEIAARHGVFQLITKDSSVIRKSSVLEPLQLNFEGTCVQIRLNLENLTTEKILETVKNGEDLLASTGAAKTSSAKSKSFTDW